jgi:hypothetical protein
MATSLQGAGSSPRCASAWLGLCGKNGKLGAVWCRLFRGTVLGAGRIPKNVTPPVHPLQYFVTAARGWYLQKSRKFAGVLGQVYKLNLTRTQARICGLTLPSFHASSVKQHQCGTILVGPKFLRCSAPDSSLRTGTACSGQANTPVSINGMLVHRPMCLENSSERGHHGCKQLVRVAPAHVCRWLGCAHACGCPPLHRLIHRWHRHGRKKLYNNVLVPAARGIRPTLPSK